MAQLERARRSIERPQTPRTSPISDHHHLADHEEFGTPTLSLSQDRGEHDDFNASLNKKSVLTKVRDRAKKLRHSLSGKSRRHGNIHTSPLHGAVASEDADAFGDADDEFDEDLDQDPEYLGAPMYESEAAPKNLKEHGRQYPRAEPVLSESHKSPSEALNETESNRTQTTGETDMVNKVKEAVHSMFGRQEPSNSTAKSTPAASSSSSSTLRASADISRSRQQNQNLPNVNSAPLIPLSDQAQEVVEEQNHGKILQAN